MGLTITIPALSLRSWGITASIWLVVVTLALLNPLACLIHCSVMDVIDHRHSMMSAALQFVCDMHMDAASMVADATHGDHVAMQPAFADQMNGSTSNTTSATVPRAVYESVPLVFVALLLALACLYAHAIRFLLSLSSRSDRPPLPPPRFA